MLLIALLNVRGTYVLSHLRTHESWKICPQDVLAVSTLFESKHSLQIEHSTLIFPHAAVADCECKLEVKALNVEGKMAWLEFIRGWRADLKKH